MTPHGDLAPKLCQNDAKSSRLDQKTTPLGALAIRTLYELALSHPRPTLFRRHGGGTAEGNWIRKRRIRFITILIIFCFPIAHQMTSKCTSKSDVEHTTAELPACQPHELMEELIYPRTMSRRAKPCDFASHNCIHAGIRFNTAALLAPAESATTTTP